VDDGHVLAERAPLPPYRGFHRLAVDVLGPLDVIDDHVALHVFARREREAAIAHDDGGDAVPAGAAAQRIPEHLGVHVRVAVDETRRDHLAGGVDLFLAFFRYAPDRRNSITGHADVRSIFRQPCSVHYRAVTNHEIVHFISSNEFPKKDELSARGRTR